MARPLSISTAASASLTLPAAIATSSAMPVVVSIPAAPPAVPPGPPVPAPAPPPAPAESATAVLASVQIDQTHWQYNITLNDTGRTTIGTFWFGWVPGKNLMKSFPTGVLSPTGWIASITNIGINDGYAIQWTSCDTDRHAGTPRLVASASPAPMRLR